MQRLDLCFDALYAAVEEAPLFLKTKIELQACVRYFKNQSLCHSDRVDKDLDKTWREFLKLQGSEIVLKKFKETKHWPPIANFFNEPIFELENQKPSGLVDFFFCLKRQSKDLPIPWSEKLALRAGLTFLFAEAEKMEKPQKEKVIRETWHFILPLMRKHKLLDQFKGQEELKKKLEDFLGK